LPRATSTDPSSAALNSAASDVLAEAAPGSPPDARATCQQLLRRGKFSDINAICGRAFAAAPDASLAVQIARNALERERYTDAQAWATKAIEVDAQLGEAFLTLGGAEQGLGHAGLARTAYKRYLELEPDGPFAEDVRALINQL
jgi:tetratricopeptide (TPR) repeat protein